jgi:ribose/xylose/arabinose/galactoside ABC-type transport system permease subunit
MTLQSSAPTPSPASSPPTPPMLAGERFSLKAFLWRWLDIIGPAIALLLVFLFFTLLVPEWERSDFRSASAFFSQLHRFANFDNVSNILRQSSMTAVASLGMTFIIIAGGIDLSAGSLAALSCVIVAVTLNKVAGESTYLQAHPAAWPVVAAVVGVGVGLLGGLLNGALVTGLRIVPFIITLGTMMILRGMAKGFAQESEVPTASNWLHRLLAPPSGGLEWMLFPPAIWITVVLAIVMAVILSFSRFGRHVIAVGSNEQTARLCGIPVNRTKFLVYTLGGLFSGIAGLFFYSRIREGSPTAADAFELEVIAAVVIGGASLAGGKGSIFGSLVGALILNVIARGCSQIHIPQFAQHFVGSATGLPTYIQQVVTGVIIILAVLLDRLRQRRVA